MDYVSGYLNAKNLADQIVSTVTSGKTVKGLGGSRSAKKEVDTTDNDIDGSLFAPLSVGSVGSIFETEDGGSLSDFVSDLFSDDSSTDSEPVSIGSAIDVETNMEGAEDYLAMLDEQPDTSYDAKPMKLKDRTGDNSLAMGVAEVESIIRREAKLRNIDPDVAVRLWQHEGGASYQSNVDRDPSKGGSINGKEASFGPFQLFIGGGMGNDYEERTGRSLIDDNTKEGITTQIQFALDMATRQGWTPWYGRGPAGIGKRQGLANSKPVGNWRKK